MTKTTHHHGNLRAALIQAGLEILEEDGVDGLTLRKAAARAGVSHAAPAHHFDGKHGLLVAIATEGFRLFSKTMQDDRFVDGDSPRAQAIGISRGYLRFAAEHPALFQLIFSVDYKEDDDPALQEASAASYGVLSEVCDLFEPSPHGPNVNEITVWSIVHGYATLTRFARGRRSDEQTPMPIEWLLPDLKPKQKK